MIYATNGSRGENVKKIQQKLGVSVDGIYGPVTIEAVRQFQRNKGLKVDGIVGDQTWSALMGGAVGGTAGMPTDFGGGLNMVIGGILLYGWFKVLMKVF